MNDAQQMNQSHQTSWSFIIIFIALFVMVFFVLKVSAASADPSNYETITIQKGDTIWEIADQYKQQAHMKRQSFIRWVEGRNHVVSRKLMPGKQLIIPIEKH